MKANEFRLGNLINEKWRNSSTGKYEYSLITISSIYSTHIRCQDDHAYNFEDCELIPLTEEWLLKFGFSKMTSFGSSNYWSKKIDGQFISFYNYEGDKYWKLENINYVSYLYYVHQLQNLIFALTNKELTLKQINYEKLV